MADDTDTLTLTAEIVSSYLGNASHVNAADIPGIIKSVRQALSEAASATDGAEPVAEETEKASKAQIRKSVTPDGLISFVDGKSYKTLKRHLSRHGMDMAAYRERYGLPSDYPSVSPNYSQARSEMAKSLGLGARRKVEDGAPAQAPAEASADAAKPEAAPAKPAARRKKAAG